MINFATYINEYVEHAYHYNFRANFGKYDGIIITP